MGVDAHRFAPNRRLILGGEALEHPLGLAGHSDADVLCHAVAEALLGAAGLGDLGQYFPDSDPAWKDASSLDLLRRVALLIRKEDLRIGYVDATVLCESPKLAPHRDRMRANMAEALGVDPGRVHVKGKTTEGMGFEGRGEGISAWAVGLVMEASD
jgi:2-C-methyl-D-erythritol 2,4-cyclodiphosphate synthase